MSKDQKDKFVRVIDSSCTHDYPERTHTINVRGEKIAVVFKFGEEKILPFEQGAKFTGIEGFRVEAVDGHSIDIPAVPTDSVAAQLARDECVAKFKELTLPSLKVRAAQKQGGEIYLDADDDSRAEIIAFIMGEPPADTGTGKDEDGFVDGEDDLLEDDGEENQGVPDDVSDEAPAETGDGEGAFAPTLADDHQKRVDEIVEYFGKGYEGVTFQQLDERDDGVATFAVVAIVEGSDTVIASGTFLELQEAVLQNHPAPPHFPLQAKGGDAEVKFALNEIKGATDEALQLCVDYGVDIKTLIGTGKDGNVLKGDVENYIRENDLKPVTHTMAGE